MKKLELTWKALWFRAIFRYLARRLTPPLPDWRKGAHRVLFIRPDGIGDAINSVRLFEAVAGIGPEMRVDVLGSPANAPFLRRLDFVDQIFVFDKRKKGALLSLARELRRQRYDAVIDCRLIAPSLTGLLLMLASGAPHRFAIGARGVDRALTFVVPTSAGHVTEQLTLLGAPFRLPPEDIGQRPKLSVTPAERAWAAGQWGERSTKRRLLINVSAGEPSRAWRDARYLEVLRAVKGDTDVLLIGGPGESTRIEAIARRAGVPTTATPSFGHVIALVEQADVVLSPDTSVVHVASAFCKPTVALYLRGTAVQWGAFEVAGANLESTGRTLSSIIPAAVLAELIPLIDS